MLSYAQRVADGYRPPAPPFWPPQVAQLVAACCAQEPHERPRMGEVLEALRELGKDESIVSRLNAYVHRDVGFVPLWAVSLAPTEATATTVGSAGGPEGGSGAGGGGTAGEGGGSGVVSGDSGGDEGVGAQGVEGENGGQQERARPACGCVIC